jgi:hypothetical protein
VFNKGFWPNDGQAVSVSVCQFVVPNEECMLYPQSVAAQLRGSRTGSRRTGNLKLVLYGTGNSAFTNGSGPLTKSFALLLSSSSRRRSGVIAIAEELGNKARGRDTGGAKGVLILATSKPVVREFSRVPARKQEGEGARTNDLTTSPGTTPKSTFPLTNTFLQIRMVNQIC